MPPVPPGDADPAGPGARPVPDLTLPVPEIRDYRQINAQLAQALDAGARHVRLAGVERQRLLVEGLRGGWDAVVEVEGPAGPELAAGLDAPRLRVVALGTADDGAGRGLCAGRLLILGGSGDCLGYAQRGGAIVAAGPVGHRAGLDQAGGLLFLAGPVGRLLAERQSGGTALFLSGEAGPHAGLGRRGGRLAAVGSATAYPGGAEVVGPEDLSALEETLRGLEPWLPPSLLGRTAG